MMVVFAAQSGDQPTGILKNDEGRRRWGWIYFAGELVGLSGQTTNSMTSVNFIPLRGQYQYLIGKTILNCFFNNIL